MSLRSLARARARRLMATVAIIPIMAITSGFVGFAGFAPGIAWAEPFAGEAVVNLGPGASASRARKQALTEARGAALAKALDAARVQAGSQVDAAAVDAVRAQPLLWTSAYRVLDEERSDSAVKVEVEVDVELPRLTKRISAVQPTRARGYSIGNVELASSCAPANSATLLDPLRSAGVVVDGGESLTISVRCRAMGPVTPTRLAGVRVDAEVKSAHTQFDVGEHGFAEDVNDALGAALAVTAERLAETLADEMRADLRIVVRAPWPSSRVRRLIVAIEGGVLGVDSVALGELRAGGAQDLAVVLDVQTSIDAVTLVQRLGKLSFPDFELSELEVESSRVVVTELR